MEINLGNIKLEKAITVSFYIMSLIIPGVAIVFVYAPDLFKALDLFKLSLLCVSLTGFSTLFHFLLNTAFISFLRVVTILNEKSNNKKTLLEEQEDIVQQKNKSKDKNSTSAGEVAVYLSFVVNDFAAMAVFCNLLRLKYFLNLSSVDLLSASVKTYFLICGI